MKVYIASCASDGGIYYYDFQDGRLIEKQKKLLDYPMYMALDDSRLHVVLREPPTCDGDSGIISISMDEDGFLGEAGDIIGTQGTVGCHLCTFHGDIYCANYLSGSVARVGKKLKVHSGKGPNPHRQEMAHVHYTEVSPDGKYLLVCDLGLDTIFVYDHELNEVSRATVPAGHGVRHLISSEDGRIIYSANELESTVSVFAYSDGQLRYMDTVSVLPPSFRGENTVAAIRLRNDRLYVSNRGHNSIAVMDITKTIPQCITWVDTLGESPRDFNLVGDHLICTNESSDNIVVFQMDGDVFTCTDIVKCKSPLCVLSKE